MASKALLSPKIIFNELGPQIVSVTAQPTAVWAVFGVTEKGPHETTRVQSWDEFVTIYGDWTSDAKDLPAAVKGFFENGGQFCYVTRIVHYTDITDASTLTSVAAEVTLVDRANVPLDTLTVTAISDGTWGNDLRIQITAPTSGASDEFNLVVKTSAGIVLETWANLSMDEADTRYVETIINADNVGSKYIVVTDEQSATASPNNRPAVATTALTGGDDGLTNLADTDFIGDEAGGTGFHRLKVPTDWTLISVPGRATNAVHNGIFNYLDSRLDVFAFAVLEVPQNQSASQAVTYVKSTASLFNLTERGAIYWPWVNIVNPAKTVYGSDATITVPPCGHVAGVYARTDDSIPGGIYRAPAGESVGVLRGVVSLESDEAKEEGKRDLVYPARINPITVMDGTPIHIDGVRTLKENGNWPTIAQRRGVLFIQSTVKRIMRSFMFANIDEQTQQSAQRSVEAFLTAQMNVGAFRSRDPEQAYFVDFGPGVNTLSVVLEGKLKGRIGLATQRPAEFIELEFSELINAQEAELIANS